jgi:hypothetical protein
MYETIVNFYIHCFAAQWQTADNGWSSSLGFGLLTIKNKLVSPTRLHGVMLN